MYKAKYSINICAFQFTSNKIAEAVLNKFREEVNIKILIDKMQRRNKYSKYKFFKNNYINISVDKAKGFVHNKFIIIDDRYVITGSYNFTEGAELRNYENLVMFDGILLAKKYKDYFETRYSNRLSI